MNCNFELIQVPGLNLESVKFVGGCYTGNSDSFVNISAASLENTSDPTFVVSSDSLGTHKESVKNSPTDIQGNSHILYSCHIRYRIANFP